jgi:sec-independent protein translocase protein TatB
MGSGLSDRGGLDDELLGEAPAEFLVRHVVRLRRAPGRPRYPRGVSFGLTFDKLLIIGVIAVFLIGPDRLPGYAAQLGRLVRTLRGFADGAKDRMREEMGPEFDEVDWKKLDPRQYDPRRIIRQALLDEPVLDGPEAAGEKPVSPGGPTTQKRYIESAYEQRQRKLGKGKPAPYDVEST